MVGCRIGITNQRARRGERGDPARSAEAYFRGEADVWPASLSYPTLLRLCPPWTLPLRKTELPATCCPSLSFNIIPTPASLLPPLSFLPSPSPLHDPCTMPSILAPRRTLTLHDVPFPFQLHSHPKKAPTNTTLFLQKQGRRQDSLRIQPRRRRYTPSCPCAPRGSIVSTNDELHRSILA